MKSILDEESRKALLNYRMQRADESLEEAFDDFNITPTSFRLSLRDKNNKEKYFDDDKMWEKAENTLRKVLKDLNIDFVENRV